MKLSKIHKHIFLLFLITIPNWAQKKELLFINNDSLNTKLSLQEIKDISSLHKTLNDKGYYFYTADQTETDSTITYTISLGNKTSVLKIKNSHKEISSILKNHKDNFYLPVANVNTWLQQLNSEFDKKGENFTEIVFKNHSLQNDTLSCDIHLEKSDKRYIDKTVVKHYTRFSKRFLKHYIKSKKPFSKELLNETEKKINQLTFVKNQKKPAVLFTKDSTHLYLYLDKVKANTLDALIGFSNQEGESKIKLNGYIDLSLTNTLHKGETFAFKWNSSGQDQQEIALTVDNPYIFNSPINTNYQLNIFKQDSSFVNTTHKFSISYKPHYKHTIQSYYHTERSTTLANTSSNQEYTKKFIGIGYRYKEINNWRNPKLQAEFEIASGKRTTEETINQQTFSSDILYNIELNPTNYFHIQNRNAYLRSSKKTNNELYRTGGATTMRGFLEQSIVSHLYNYTNLEFRHYNNPISYLYAFSDVGHFRNLTSKNDLLSLGLGYTLGTPSGLLKISYAVGKTQNTNFNLSNGLFHINFVTIF